MIQVARTLQRRGPRKLLGPVGEPELDGLMHPEEKIAGPLGNRPLPALQRLCRKLLLNVVKRVQWVVIRALHISPLVSL